MLQPITNLLQTITKCWNLENTKTNHIRIFSPKYEPNLENSKEEEEEGEEENYD